MADPTPEALERARELELHRHVVHFEDDPGAIGSCSVGLSNQAVEVVALALDAAYQRGRRDRARRVGEVTRSAESWAERLLPDLVLSTVDLRASRKRVARALVRVANAGRVPHEDGWREAEREVLERDELRYELLRDWSQR